MALAVPATAARVSGRRLR